MIDKRFLRYFDWISFGLMLAILSIGLLFVFSSTYRPEEPFSVLFKKQLFGAGAGLVLYFIFCIKDMRRLTKVVYCLYLALLVLLAYTFLCGWVGMGGQRWISLYFFRFQPSEIAKLLLPMFMAIHFAGEGYEKVTEISLEKLFFPVLVLLTSFVLILKQPDLGTALLVLMSGGIMLWFVGVNRTYFILLGILLVIGIPVMWTFLKPYQQQRIKVLFGYGDVRKERYQIEQSKIAIGSGGLLGKGVLNGTQSKLSFLPEDHTDFIFSVICEEWGFWGAVLTLFLYGLLFVRLCYIVLNVGLFFNQVVAIGLMAHIFLSVCVNVGMVVGILPVVGIPLPLVSCGLSNLWITLASFGWLNHIAIRRFYY